MNQLASRILKIKEHLSNQETWEKFHDISEAGFNLGNDLAGLWCCATGPDKRFYPAAYNCVARAALDWHKEAIVQSELYLNLHFHHMDAPFQADEIDVRTVWAFEKICTHEQLMQVLDRSIHYANLWIFS